MRKADIEDGFEDVLKTLTPSRKLFGLVRAMFADAWEMRSLQAHEARAEWKRQLKDTEKQIEELIDRLVEMGNRTVVKKLEERIEKLERHKIVLAEKVAKEVPSKARLEDCMELTLRFLSSPWDIYKNGTHAVRQTVLRLAFEEPLKYCRNEGYGTPRTNFPFAVLEGFTGHRGKMVQSARRT